MDLENLENALSVRQTNVVNLSSFVEPNNKFDLSIGDYLGKRETFSHKPLLPDEVQQKVKELAKTEEEIRQIENLIPTEAHPLLLEQRKQANQLVEKLTNKIDHLLDAYKTEMRSKPACPYKQTLQEYLGKSYKVRTIHELPMPNFQTFSIQETAVRSVNIFQKIEEKGFLALKMLSDESLSEGGIKTQELGHAFCTVAMTSSGSEFSIDKEKTSKYLSFVETIRNTPHDYILENPRMFAYKVLHSWCDLFKDIETEVELMSAAQPIHLREQQENPAKLLVEYADTFNSLFEHQLIEKEQIDKHKAKQDQQKLLR